MDTIGSTISVNTIESKIDRLRSQLGCPIGENDPNGSDFWYLRLGDDEETAAETRPIAVKFYDELNILSNDEIKRWLTEEEQQQEIYTNHYIDRVNQNQPAMYLLYPTSEDSGRVAFILPQEGGIKQRHIQTFDLVNDRELDTRIDRLKKVPIEQNFICWMPLIERVFYEPIKTSRTLAEKLSEPAKRIEKIISGLYKQGASTEYLDKLLKSFQTELLPDLKGYADREEEHSFADIYAQTVTYGLFTAWVFSYLGDSSNNKDRKPFDRKYAWEYLPKTSPFLRKIFEDISCQNIEQLGDELVDEIANILAVLRAAEMEVILDDFRRKSNREDIVIRFYEDFLAAYNPRMRKIRGIFFTPKNAVDYIVKSVDLILKQDFGLVDGLANASKIEAVDRVTGKVSETHKVLITDVATGTGTFLHSVIDNIDRSFDRQAGDWSNYVSQDLLPRISGFELLMAPYAVAHMKLGLQLAESGYKFDTDARLQVCLTNALSESFQIPPVGEFANWIRSESDIAKKFKQDAPVMVLMGNPPYSGHSANNGDWIKGLLRGYDSISNQQTGNYFEVDDKPLGERNPKYLNDDYVKFIRFAQWRIERTGYGILAFITNHSYLDNATFRGMRQSLMQTFDDIYVLDLHGNSKNKEKCPDGSKDENIFDIQQGVSICFFVKKQKEVNYACKTEELANVYRAELYGKRTQKNEWLEKSDISCTEWNKLNPQSPDYLFIWQNNELRPEYEQGWKITDIFPVNSTGVKTHRDHFVFDFDRSSLEKRIGDFRDLSISNDRMTSLYDIKDTRDWKIKDCRRSLANESSWEEHFTKCLYRPFDFREYYHHADVVELPRQEVMQHLLLGVNLGLICRRQMAGEIISYFFASEFMVSDGVIGADNKGRESFFPLYLYPTTQVETDMGMACKPNISLEFLTHIEQTLGYLPTPEAIFYYIYAIFHSPTYRSRYAEFLKTDFPRVPLTSNSELFENLATFGERLVNLHLMKSVEIERGGNWESGGNLTAEVGAGYPKYESGKIIINKQGDGFIDAPADVWNFHVGGYQVCHKWLKDRKGRVLSAADIAHYQGIVAALGETIEVMQAIDAAIPNWPLDAE